MAILIKFSIQAVLTILPKFCYAGWKKTVILILFSEKPPYFFSFFKKCTPAQINPSCLFLHPSSLSALLVSFSLTEASIVAVSEQQ